MKTVQTIYGVFDTDLGRLVGIAPQGVPDVTFIAGQDTQTDGLPVTSVIHPVTGGVSFQGPDGQQYYAGKVPDLRRERGSIFIDWSSQQGAAAMVSVNSGEAFALDPAVLCDGLPSIKCTFSSAGGTYDARFTPTNPLSLKNVTSIQIPIRITSNESASNVGTGAAPFQIWLKTATKQVRFQCDFQKTRPGEWQLFSFTRSETSQVTFGGGATWATLDSETVTAIEIMQSSAAASVNYPVWIGPLSVNARAKGIISLRMDGGYISQYSLIKPLLDQYGFKTTLALVHQSINYNDTFLTAAQVTEFWKGGHEIAHHTFDRSKINGYVNATDWPTAASITDDVNAGWANLRANGWLGSVGVAVEGYTSCFVSTQNQARQQLVKDALRAAGVKFWSSSVPWSKVQNSTRSYPEIKPWCIRGAVQVTNTHTAADIIAAIDQAESNGEWAPITLHRAVNDAATPGSLEIRIGELATVFAYLKSRVDAGGVVVVPLGAAYSAIHG